MTQNISTVRSSLSDAAAASHWDTTDYSETADEPGKASCHKLSDQPGIEVVCGPVELAKYVDLSGMQGIVPLTSMKLLRVKSKSFLLRFKSKSNRAEKSTATADKPTQVNMFATLNGFIVVIIVFPMFLQLLFKYFIQVFVECCCTCCYMLRQ